MVLFMQYWNFKTTNRKNEIYNALLKNCSNRYITKIIIFVEKDTQISLNHNKIKSIVVDNKLSYSEIIMGSIKYCRNDICIVSNADIYFDGTLSMLHNIDLDNKIISLTSYDSYTNSINDFSIDSWIFNSGDINISNDFLIGDSFSDLKLLKDILDNNISVINPSLDIHSYHIDSVRRLKRDYSEKFLFINPSKIDKPQIVRDNVDIIIKSKVDIPRVVPKVVSKAITLPTPSSKVMEKVTSSNNSKSIAIHIHLYYQDLWQYFEGLLDNMDDYNFDLYVTITENISTKSQTLWISKQIESIGGKVFLLPNKGLDIGPFLYVLKYFIDNNVNYDYILKLHSKKSIVSAGKGFGNKWRSELISPLIGSKDIVKNNINYLQSVGMLGSKKWLSKSTQGNDSMIDNYKKILNINMGDTFIGGTMFWVRYEILRKYFNKFNIGVIYNELEEGYFTDHEYPTKTHSLERIFGYIVQDYGNKILGI